ncbi:hypothetical protein [Antrihabitans stalactiti]|jgi:hypothetical protein|uniref:Uncharacterized protein n=1 Tax=Antrihabitans stalactiti TaxID=2584121 RepID=A0A848KKR1_9NOCA|nr:hypothetical protein [Antrihabitans stalactiti]NMN98731.1 hypothetical protein [Antrihabitans stalactiti]
MPIEPPEIPDDAPITKTVVNTAIKVLEQLPQGAQDAAENLRGPFDGILGSIVELEHTVTKMWDARKS